MKNITYTSWEEFFNSIKDDIFFINLMSYVNKEYKEHTCYPQKEDIFNAFKYTPLDKVKVVILGQDPYIHKDEAMGLAFSVTSRCTKLPPSLKNIYKEIINEYKLDIELPKSGDLTYLSKEGVLLLNPILTVREGVSLSHKCKEYDLLFKAIMNALNKINRPIVFMLWGTKARSYKKLLNNPLHLVIETNHPSPLSANRGGWFNSNCFINTNNFLIKNNIEPIKWIK